MNCTLRVLMIEDSESDAEFVLRELQRYGYLVDAMRVQEEAEFVEALRSRTWDAITCDYSLPKFCATDALKLVQSARLDIPFLIVSGTIGEEIAVQAMKAGAHDYIMKDHLGRLAPALGRELREAADRRRRNRTEEELRFQAHLLDAVGQAVVATDLSAKVTYWNRSAEALYGWPASEALGQDLLELTVPELWRSKALESLSCLQSGQSWSGEMVVRRRNGETFVAMVTHTPVRDRDQRVVGIIGISNDVTQRKRAETDLRSSREQLRALAARLESVREEERKLVARDLHDELGQALTGLKLDLAWMRNRLGAETSATTAVLLEKISAMGALIDATSNTVRALCASLRPAALDDLGLVAAIQWQAREFSKRTGVICEVSPPSSPFTLATPRSSSIFRIFQEILTNVARHAKARRVTVNLQLTDKEMILDTFDDGRGIRDTELQAANSFGLVGMRERALALGGRVEFHSKPGTGTRVILRVPLD